MYIHQQVFIYYSKNNNMAFTLKYHGEEGEASLLQGKKLVAAFRKNGFIEDIDKKGLKGKLFQFAVVDSQGKDFVANLIVPLSSIEKKHQKFMKAFFESEEEPPEKDFDKALKIALSSLIKEYQNLKEKANKSKSKSSDAKYISEIFANLDKYTEEAKQGYITEVNFYLFPTLISFKALVVH